MLTLALLLAAPADPAPDTSKTFGDWAVACDNVRDCEMTSLLPGDGMSFEEGSGYDDLMLSIARRAGPAGGFSVEISFGTQAKGMAALGIDGQTVASGTPSTSCCASAARTPRGSSPRSSTARKSR